MIIGLAMNGGPVSAINNEATPKLAILDLGNVVFQVDWQPMFEIWSEASGLSADTLQEQFRFDDNFEAFERGERGGASFHQQLCKVLGAEFSYQDFVRGWNAIYQDAFNGIEENLEILKDKMRLVAFTNTNEVHCLVWPERYRDTLSHFDHLFISSKMGVRKPEAEGFKRILDHCRVSPSEVVFFDDFAPNIEAARALGIRSYLVDSPDVLTQFVKNL
jgi:HAD superfamily hydrolase (TIGR01509 family)